MTGAERLRKWRARKRAERLAEAAGDEEQHERLWKQQQAAKKTYDTPRKALSGETEDETQARPIDLAA